MKNFNVFLIACLTFLVLTSSGCSKDEDSPYTREQLIGKWVEKSYMEVDKYGNETWIDSPGNIQYYFQFNANGTFYTSTVLNDKDSSWKLKGTKIYAKTTAYGSDNIIDYVFYIYSLTDKELIIKAKDSYSKIQRTKYIKER